MIITGNNLIGTSVERGKAKAFYGHEAASGALLDPPFYGADQNALERACALADQAFDIYREIPLDRRANFLETAGRNILELGDALIIRAMAETGLSRGRLEGERARTVDQLRLFAGVLRDGSFLDLRIDPAQPDRQPAPRVDLRQRHIPLGPVVVFGASNFPLAFSVAGGDTASALAAGCPVIVKAHSAHPGTAELVGRAMQKAVKDCELPEGVFSLLFGDRAIGQGLVADPRITAVGFTGSRVGGLALVTIARSRPVPIPVYAEMSSINPVLLFPHALTARGSDIAKSFITALTLGAGQFCTNPGLLLAVKGPALDGFLDTAAAVLADTPAAVMLTAGIRQAFLDGVQRLHDHPDVTEVGRGRSGEGTSVPGALFTVDADVFRGDPGLQQEVFGASSLVIQCRSLEEMRELVPSLEGQLTAALHVDPQDYAAAATFLPVLERLSGRILVNGFGTGVEVGHAMVHGGPFPATTDGRTTSVGSLAIARFLRPVSYQDLPDALLPAVLKTGNPLGLPQRIDGTR